MLAAFGVKHQLSPKKIPVRCLNTLMVPKHSLQDNYAVIIRAISLESMFSMSNLPNVSKRSA